MIVNALIILRFFLQTLEREISRLYRNHPMVRKNFFSFSSSFWTSLCVQQLSSCVHRFPVFEAIDLQSVSFTAPGE